MKKVYLIEENLNEFARRGRPRKSRAPKAINDDPEMEDSWYSADDEFDSDEVGPEQIEDVELEDEVTDLAIQKRLAKMLDNELKISEISRGALNFTKRSTGENISGVPLARLSDGEAYLFKTKSGMKKARLDDMVVEGYTGQQIFVSESFKDYE